MPYGYTSTRTESTSQAWGQAVVADKGIVSSLNGEESIVSSPATTNIVVDTVPLIQEGTPAVATDTQVIQSFKSDGNVVDAPVDETKQTISSELINTAATDPARIVSVSVTSDPLVVSNPIDFLTVEPGPVPVEEDLVMASIIGAAAAGNATADVTLSISTLATIEPTAENVATDLAASAGGNVVPTSVQKTESVTVLPSETNSADLISEAIEASCRIDLQVVLRSKKSEVIEFNNLKVPKPQTKLFYNFFVGSEKNIAIQEDPAMDPLLKNDANNVPRYVEIKWQPIKVTAQLPEAVDVEKINKSVRRQVFEDIRGQTSVASSNQSRSVSRQNKNFNPYVQDGISKTVTDIHEPEKAINSIVNSLTFPNSVRTTVNTTRSSDYLSSLPYKIITVR